MAGLWPLQLQFTAGSQKQPQLGCNRYISHQCLSNYERPSRRCEALATMEYFFRAKLPAPGGWQRGKPLKLTLLIFMIFAHRYDHWQNFNQWTESWFLGSLILGSQERESWDPYS